MPASRSRSRGHKAPRKGASASTCARKTPSLVQPTRDCDSSDSDLEGTSKAEEEGTHKSNRISLKVLPVWMIHVYSKLDSNTDESDELKVEIAWLQEKWGDAEKVTVKVAPEVRETREENDDMNMETKRMEECFKLFQGAAVDVGVGWMHHAC
ncbi:hypothetical protein VNI00_008819 [Paramarasmius palmivorus]|uniref:Uncharacterized protein n=1 Tax=Paramarasmius palmivorus TaxID=297713 RepID=A0AAW0CP80_9AGAR